MKEHGTRAAYQSGCRCLPCRAANAQHVSAWRLAKADGWPSLRTRMPATDLHRLIRSLLVDGFTKREICRRAGLSKLPEWRHTSRVTLRNYLKIRRLYRSVHGEG